jgi:hypothetical protein
VEVSLEDLEWQFLVEDQVCVALGENKGRTGSIVEINDSVGTIIERMANKVIEVNLTVFFFIYHLFYPVPIPIALS